MNVLQRILDDSLKRNEENLKSYEDKVNDPEYYLSDDDLKGLLAKIKRTKKSIHKIKRRKVELLITNK